MTAIDTLAETLDAWAGLKGGASITETNVQVAVNQLSGAQAARLLDLVAATGWPEAEAADAGGILAPAQVTEVLQRVRVTFEKPRAPDDVELILTNTAFLASLGRRREGRRVWICRLSAPLVTWGVRYAPWGDDLAFTPAPAAADPRRVVRALGAYPDAVADLDRWVLADPAVHPADIDTAYGVWREQAARALAHALANEVEPDGRLMFRGPPVSRFRAGDGTLADMDFDALQRAAAWAHGNPRESENRHGLMAAEIARAALRDGDLKGLAEVAADGLEGARIAYNFGVAGQSRDTLKALADLRKAVTDETARLAETTRGLSAAVAGALLGHIGVIIARLSLPASGRFVGEAALAIGIVLLIYVLAVIVSGVLFLRLQQKLRDDWRQRLYSFLTPDEYKRMVSKPIRRAEIAFYVTVVGAVIMVGLSTFAMTRVATSLSEAAPSPPVASAATPSARLKTEGSSAKGHIPNVSEQTGRAQTKPDPAKP